MEWSDVEELAANGQLTGAQWISRYDGVREEKEKDCAVFKVCHRGEALSARIEYGLLGSEKVFKVKQYLEQHGISGGPITERNNTIATLSGKRFRIGYGSTMPYLVFKPENLVSLYLPDLDPADFSKQFHDFAADVLESGLPELLAKF